MDERGHASTAEPLPTARLVDAIALTDAALVSNFLISLFPGRSPCSVMRQGIVLSCKEKKRSEDVGPGQNCNKQVFFDDWNAADAVVHHQLGCLLDRILGAQRDQVCRHYVFDVDSGRVWEKTRCFCVYRL
jgi:hypothetical protein